MSEKPKSPFVTITGAAGFMMAILMLILMITVTTIVGLLGAEDRSWIAGDGAGAIAILILISWPVRKEYWFWAAVLFFVALHVGVIFGVDWSFTHSWSGRAVGSLIYPDITFMVAVVYALYRLKYGAPAEVIADPVEEPTYSQRDLDL